MFPTAVSRPTSASTVTTGPGTESDGVPTQSWTNHAPTISANPPDTIKAGTVYSYAPSASDPDNDSLYFSVSNLPSWADFNPRTGEIRGRPTMEDMGAHTDIKISVSDGRGGSASTFSFGIWVVASGLGSATLDWIPPLEHTDGSPLTDLAGYIVFWSLNPDEFVNSVRLDNPGLTSYVISELTRGTWYFTMRAFDSDGIMSPFATIASTVVD